MNNDPTQNCEQCNLAQHDPRIRIVINLISRKFREPICICELGRIAGMEPSELSHLFKAETGMNPKQLLSTLRIAHALEQLINTDNQIKGIAADVGLPVVDTFIRNFARICGVTPGEFREMIQELETDDVYPPQHFTYQGF